MLFLKPIPSSIPFNKHNTLTFSLETQTHRIFPHLPNIPHAHFQTSFVSQRETFYTTTAFNSLYFPTKNDKRYLQRWALSGPGPYRHVRIPFFNLRSAFFKLRSRFCAWEWLMPTGDFIMRVHDGNVKHYYYMEMSNLEWKKKSLYDLYELFYSIITFVYSWSQSHYAIIYNLCKLWN